MNLKEIIQKAQAGEILHLRQPEAFKPLFDLFESVFVQIFDDKRAWNERIHDLSWEETLDALAKAVHILDQKKEHYQRFAKALQGLDCLDYKVLEITFDKSLRLCLPGQGKKNYGYYIHQDSWFDLAPDGVNLIFYLTDVDFSGNTLFFPGCFGQEIVYDSESRQLQTPLHEINPAVSYSVQAHDLLVFSGEQLHGGAKIDHSRFSIEFRITQATGYGRPDQGICYQPISQYLP